MIELYSVGKFQVNGKDCYSTKNPIECDDFEHLINKTVFIDGTERKVTGVERFMHSPPWLKGEPIALMVE